MKKYVGSYGRDYKKIGWHFGIIHDGEFIRNHRSILKVFLNPILRYLFRINIVSEMEGKLEDFLKKPKVKLSIMKSNLITRELKYNLFDKETGKNLLILRKRVFW